MEKVDVGANHNMTTTLLHHHPKTGLEAKFSMEFCIAILLLERKAGLGQFSDKVVQRPDVREMIRKINFYVDPEAESAGFDKMTSHSKDHSERRQGNHRAGGFWQRQSGESHELSTKPPKNSAGAPNLRSGRKAKTEKIIAFVKTLEAAPDMSALSPLLSSARDEIGR